MGVEPGTIDERERQFNQTIANDTDRVQDDEIDLKRYLQILVHFKWIFLLVVILTTIGVGIYAYLLKPMYESEFSVYYDDESLENIEKDERNGAVLLLGGSYWEEVMNTEGLLNKTREKSGCALSIEDLKNGLTAESNKLDKNIFRITLRVPEREMIHPVANAFVESLNELDGKNYTGKYSSMIEFYKTQLVRNEKELTTTEDQILGLNSKLNAPELKSMDQLQEIFEGYKKQLNESQIELAALEATKKNLKRDLSSKKDTLLDDVSYAEPLQEQLMTLYVELATNLTKYKEDHPIVKGVRENIERVEKMLQEGVSVSREGKKLATNPFKRKLITELLETETKEMSVKARISSLEKIIADFSAQIRPGAGDNGLTVLLRKRDLLVSTNELLSEKILEAEANIQGKNNRFSLIDIPVIPDNTCHLPFHFFLLGGIILGVFLGLGLIIAIDLFDNRIKLVSDFEQLYSMPILGTLQNRKGKFTAAAEVNRGLEEDQLLTYELSEIRNNINQLSQSEKLIAITSPTRKEGKTLCSYLMAREMARVGKKVLLVDIDTYIPKLTSSLGATAQMGLCDYLFEEKNLSEVVQPGNTDNLFTVVAGNNKFGNQIYYNSSRFKRFVQEVSESFDLVIFDTPALLHIPDMLAFFENVEALIFIARMNHTSRMEMDKVLRKLKGTKARKLGTVLTGVKPNKLDGYSNYNYYYNYRENVTNQYGKKRFITWPRSIAAILVIALGIGGYMLYTSNMVTASESSESEYTTVEKISEDIQAEKNTQVVETKIEERIKPQTVVASKIEKPIEKVQPVEATKHFHVSAGCFRTRENANTCIAELTQAGFTPRLYGKLNNLYTVVYGSYKTRAEATKVANDIVKNRGLEAVVFVK